MAIISDLSCGRYTEYRLSNELKYAPRILERISRIVSLKASSNDCFQCVLQNCYITASSANLVRDNDIPAEYFFKKWGDYNFHLQVILELWKYFSCIVIFPILPGLQSICLIGLHGHYNKVVELMFLPMSVGHQYKTGGRRLRDFFYCFTFITNSLWFDTVW